MATRSGVLLFDGECGFCTSVADWGARRLPEDARVEAWQLADDLGGVSKEEASRAAYWIDARGRVHRGHRAVAEVLRAMGGAWGAAGAAMRFPPVSWLAAGVYEVVARNRHRLPGSTPACRR